MVKEFAAKHGSALRSLAAVAATLAAAAAVVVGAVLAVVFAATVALMAIMSSALLALAGLSLRARRTAKARRADNLIEARHLGGHHWVACGWNERS